MSTQRQEQHYPDPEGLEGPSTEVMSRTLLAIGQRIREFRKLRGMTQQQLAAASGVSSSMLSLVERGIASPSIGSLIVVSEALGTSMSDLLATDDHAKDLVVRVKDTQIVRTDRNVVRRVIKEDRINGVAIAINEYAPKTSSNDTPLAHDGFEYGILLAGALTVEVDGISHVLHEGDLISYASRRPHRIWNHGDVMARTLWFNTEQR